MNSTGEVTKVKLNEIIPNGWNPHGMKEAEFENLRESIKEKGVYRPIVVIELDHPDEYTEDISVAKYRIIDGEHLHKALVYDHVEGSGPDEATVLIYGKNSEVPVEVQMEIGQQINHGLRGSLEDTHKTGEIVKRLSMTKTIEEIARRTGQSVMFLETARRVVEPVARRPTGDTTLPRRSTERQGQTIPLVFEDNESLTRYMDAIKSWEEFVDSDKKMTPGRRRIAAVLAALESSL